MNLDKDPSSKFYGLTFFGPEIEILRAAYIETSIYLEKNGNSGSISRHDNHIIQGTHGDQFHFETEDPFQTMSVLKRFVDRTDQEAIELSNLPVPAYTNRFVTVRRGLGSAAAGLLEEMEEKMRLFTEEVQVDEAVAQDSLTMDEIERQVEDFRTQLEGGMSPPPSS